MYFLFRIKQIKLNRIKPLCSCSCSILYSICPFATLDRSSSCRNFNSVNSERVGSAATHREFSGICAPIRQLKCTLCARYRAQSNSRNSLSASRRHQTVSAKMMLHPDVHLKTVWEYNDYRGMLPCFFHGFESCLVAKRSRSSHTRRRVSLGTITASR